MSTTNDELKELLITLMEKLDENTQIERELLELLKQNNADTAKISDYVSVELTTEQQIKGFLINVGANIVGNSVRTPQIINLGG